MTRIGGKEKSRHETSTGNKNPICVFLRNSNPKHKYIRSMKYFPLGKHADRPVGVNRQLVDETVRAMKTSGEVIAYPTKRKRQAKKKAKVKISEKMNIVLCCHFRNIPRRRSK
jgi:hypothetical protein